MGNGHSIISPSSAYRNFACTPSARFEQQIPEEESEYAVEGTLAHELAALVLSGRTGQFKGSHDLFNEFITAIKNQVVEFYVKNEQSAQDGLSGFFTMMEHAETWAAMIIDYGGEIFIEKEYDLSQYIPLGRGTSDGTNITPKILYVSDLKYGAGVPVRAKENTQMKLYGLGALLKARELGHCPETVVLTIFQPRAGGTSTWQLTVTELLEWAESYVRPKALLAIAGEGDFVPGEHCQFCAARLRCKAYFDKFAEALGIHDAREMSVEDRATVLTYGPMLKTWINKIEADAVKQLQSRKTIPGFKLIAGKGRRKFRDEDNVVDILLGAGFESDQIFTPSLRSLTDLEKELRPKRFVELFASEIINEAGQPKIVPEDDPSPAIGASAADEYDEEDLT